MLEKRHNECNFEYLLRLCKHKIEEKPNDLDWQDIIELTGLNVHRDTLRKAMNIDFGAYAVMKFYEEKIQKGYSNEDLLEDFIQEKKELEKMKIQYQDQKREYRKYLRSEAKFEHLLNEMKKAIKQLPPLYIKENKDDNCLGYEASLILSDWHLGLKCKNYWNEFNYKIARERIEKLKNKVIKYCNNHIVNILHIEIIGDMINGSIHLGNRVESEEDVISQAMTVSEILSTFINDLANEIPNIRVYTLYGNHGRVSPNKNDSIDIENFERLIEWYLKARLKDIENIKLCENEYDETFGCYQLRNGKNIVFSHGNYDKVSKVIYDYSKMLKIHIDEVHLGHFHNYQEKDDSGSTLVINGTLSGTDTYSKNLRLVGKPMQTLRIYSEDICTYKIYL